VHLHKGEEILQKSSCWHWASQPLPPLEPPGDLVGCLSTTTSITGSVRHRLQHRFCHQVCFSFSSLCMHHFIALHCSRNIIH
jgi:hypothetical protein